MTANPDVIREAPLVFADEAVVLLEELTEELVEVLGGAELLVEPALEPGVEVVVFVEGVVVAAVPFLAGVVAAGEVAAVELPTLVGQVWELC